MSGGGTGRSGPSARRPCARTQVVGSVSGEFLPYVARDCFTRVLPLTHFARRKPVSARAGGDLEQPLKVSSQLNLIKLQLREPAAFS